MTLSAPVRLPRFWLLLLLVLGSLLSLNAQAELKRLTAGSRPTFLTSDQAFQLLPPTREGDTLELEFQVAPGYYLYRDRFHFSVEGEALTLGTPQFPHEGEWKQDETFGRVRVYHENVKVALPVSGQGRLKVRWQGCADAGLCYPPQDAVLAVTSGAVAPATAAEATTSAAPPPPVTAEVTGRPTQLLIMFALGLALAFTPCVLPMLPILAGIVARQHTSSALRGFLLALAYVLGVAAVYALLGALVALFGQQVNLPGWFQHPVVLIVFAGLFLALALSLFGLFELRLPAALHNHFHGLSERQQGGALAGSFLMGVFSALVVSPCVSAPLFGVLLHISTTGDVLFGTLSLFLMALGMGVPLLVLGATEGRLLPRAGAWMDEVKTLLGLLLLFVAAELLTRLLPAPAALALYGFCTAALGWWLWKLSRLQHGLGLLARALAFCALVYAGALMTGAAAGGDDPLRPLATLGGNTPAARPTPFARIRDNADLDHEIAVARQNGQALMLDFYADWCVSCKVMERQVFRNPEVAARLQKLRLVQADVTANNADDRALLQRFKLLGPPSIVFFDKDGNELSQARIVGEQNAREFLAHLDAYGL